MGKRHGWSRDSFTTTRLAMPWEDSAPCAPRGTCRWCGLPIRFVAFSLLRRYHPTCKTVRETQVKERAA
jgi:hypothetical protein